MIFKHVKIAVTFAAIIGFSAGGLTPCTAADPVLVAPAPEPRLKNFEVSGTTPENCQRIELAAEAQRTKFAKLWLGKELAGWSKPCPVQVTLNATGAGGATTFAFEIGSFAPANVAIIGTIERILINQLPHEVAHTVLAAHFHGPIPRWADEGIAILSESESERKRQDQLLIQLLSAGPAL